MHQRTKVGSETISTIGSETTRLDRKLQPWIGNYEPIGSATTPHRISNYPKSDRKPSRIGSETTRSDRQLRGHRISNYEA